RRALDLAMNERATKRFQRGPDRRNAGGGSANERRRTSRREDAIHWITLFRDADPSEIEEALADCEVLALPAGTPLLRRGEANRDVFILLSRKHAVEMDHETAPQTIAEN